MFHITTDFSTNTNISVRLHTNSLFKDPSYFFPFVTATLFSIFGYERTKRNVTKLRT